MISKAKGEERRGGGGGGEGGGGEEGNKLTRDVVTCLANSPSVRYLQN